MRLKDQALLLGSTMRLTRLVVADDLGDWLVREPLMSMARDALDIQFDQDVLRHPHGRYLGGLDCPFCVGYWIGLLNLAAYHLLPRSLWRFVTGSLALNEVAAHLGARLGDTAGDE